MHYLAGRKVEGIFPANPTFEREKDYAFSKAYVDLVKLVIYMRSDAHMRWQGLESLDHLTIGFVRGWSYGKKWETRSLSDFGSTCPGLNLTDAANHFT